MFQTIQKALKQFSDDDCLTLSASLAFYTLFALPPLLFLLAIVISFGMASIYELGEARDLAREFLLTQASQLIGDHAAAVEVGNMLENVSGRSDVWWKSTLSLLGVLIGATGLMSALQSSLNRVWKVKPNPVGGLAAYFMMKRLFSLAMILGFGFVLLVSFIISSLLMIVSEYAANWLGIVGILPRLINHGLTFAMGWIFFTGIFKFMPDARISLWNALIGGFFTVTLFSLGRAALFIYFQLAEPGEQLGTAAGAVAIILLWVYYSTVILLFGAEFTVANSRIHGEKTIPETGAVEIAEKVVSKKTDLQEKNDRRTALSMRIHGGRKRYNPPDCNTDQSSRVQRH